MRRLVPACPTGAVGSSIPTFQAFRGGRRGGAEPAGPAPMMTRSLIVVRAIGIQAEAVGDTLNVGVRRRWCSGRSPPEVAAFTGMIEP